MSRSHPDRALSVVLGSVALLAGAIVVLIVAFLAREAWPALSSLGWRRFITDNGWLPAAGTSGQFNMLPMLAGSLLLTVGAVLLAAPAGVISAIFCRFYAPSSVARVYRRLTELLAGIPSVVYGFWGLVTLVPLIYQLEPPGQSLLAGILILALMILPTVALMADAALGAVPRAHLTAAAALGLGRATTVRSVALPAALPGIGTGVLLATARAIGETMAVLMVCGNVVRTPTSIFDSVRSLTANIALEMAYAGENHRSVLFVSGLVLMACVALLILGVEHLDHRAKRRTRHA